MTANQNSHAEVNAYSREVERYGDVDFSHDEKSAIEARIAENKPSESLEDDLPLQQAFQFVSSLPR